jgi:hypothetical protein
MNSPNGELTGGTLGAPDLAETASVPPRAPHGWTLGVELSTDFESRAGIVAQLLEIAKQIERGTMWASGSGSGGSVAWKLERKESN